jgi:hypothetical protein
MSDDRYSPRYDREAGLRIELRLRLAVVLSMMIVGLILIFFSAYIVLSPLASNAIVALFLFSGIFSLLLAMTAAFGIGVFRPQRSEGRKKAPSSYFDELNK